MSDRSTMIRRPPPTRLRPFGLVALVACAALGLAAAPARAADPASVRRAEAIATEAKFLFKQKAYEEAAARFFEAYTLVNKPALLFNAARAYEEAGNIDRAAALFRAYIELDGVGADGKAEASKRLAPLEKVLAERKAAESALASKAAAEQEAAQRAEAQRQAAVEAERRKAADARLEAERQAARAAGERANAERRAAEDAAARANTPGGSGVGASGVGASGSAVERKLPWLQIGVTGGAALTSGILYGLALSEADSARALEGKVTTDAQKVTYLDRASRARTFQAGAIITGIATAAAAGWLAYELVRPSEPAGKVTLTLLPSGGEGFTGALLTLHR